MRSGCSIQRWGTRLVFSFSLSFALPACALFSPPRPSTAEVCADRAPPRRAVTSASAPSAPSGTTAPARPSPVSEVTSVRGFHLRRGMTVAITPVSFAGRDVVFEVLQRMLARRSVHLLDLSRSMELRAKVHGPERERGTSLEGPWMAAVWAARWGGASHVLVSDALATAAAPGGAGTTAQGMFRLLALPGAEVVWTARLGRTADGESEALLQVLDALADALHGTLREEPEAAATTETPAATRPRRHHRRSRLR